MKYFKFVMPLVCIVIAVSFMFSSGCGTTKESPTKTPTRTFTPKDSPTITLTPTRTGTFTRTQTFTFTYTPTVASYNLPFFDDFEGGIPSSDWTIGSISTSSWILGTPNTTMGAPNAFSGSNCLGTNANGGQYYNLEDSFVFSPPIILPSASTPQLTFQNWYRIENGWDGGIVEITTDNGANWSIITPSSGYPGTTNNSNPVFPNTPAYTGSSGGTFWTVQSFDLSSYAGSTIRIRFRFASDGSVIYPGWYIDDFSVQ